MPRIGKQTLALSSRPYVASGAAVVGKAEGEGPLGSFFDKVLEDDLNGQDTFEKAERQLDIDAMRICLQKGGVAEKDVQFLLGGDLLNQIISASFSARELGVPFIGLYGACSTMSESLAVASMLVDGGFAEHALCVACSHFCTAERQYRFPLEFGSQRTPTAQWTVTGAGATLLSAHAGARPMARIAAVCLGRVVDLGIKDANNMGAAMAPAAADTLTDFFEDTQTEPADYDLVLSGDLGQVGHDLLMELMKEQHHPLSEQGYTDCGLEIFDRASQDMHAGGSGCGCSASVLNGFYLPKLQRGELNSLLFMATGALLSPTSTMQGESIPGVAHAVLLQSPKGGAFPWMQR